MKLCILSDASSLHIIEWAQFFTRKGHAVSIISDNPADIEGVIVYPIPKYESKFHIPFISSIYQVTRKTITIRRLLRKIQPDILHSHYANIYGYLASLTGFHPHILTCHGSDLLVHPKRSGVEQYFVKCAVKHADKITLPSKEMYQIAVHYGADPDKITEIQYGVDLQQFRFTNNEKDKNRFLCTRMLTPQYRTDFIIEAFSRSAAEFPNISLDIVGEGAERRNLEKMVAAKSMEKIVKFWGKIEHSDIAGFYDRASYYLTASPTDGLSISLLEAFASGVFPILPDNPSNRSVADMGFNVKLYNPDSIDSLSTAIKDVLANSEKLPQKCLHNRKLTEEKYDRSKNLACIEMLYLDVIKRD